MKNEQKRHGEEEEIEIENVQLLFPSKALIYFLWFISLRRKTNVSDCISDTNDEQQTRREESERLTFANDQRFL